MTSTVLPTRTGRRKEAIARVILQPGAGKHTINGRAPLAYLTRDSLVRAAFEALTVVNVADRYDVVATVRGGGLTGQAGALRMAIARVLASQDDAMRATLGREGLLTRDARMKERKKYGQPGARKRFQFSKR